MRQCSRAAINAFLARRAASPSQSISTDGETLYSYGTAIAQHVGEDGFLLNVTKYSKTTSRQVNEVRSELPSRMVREVSDVPKGTRNLIPYLPPAPILSGPEASRTATRRLIQKAGMPLPSHLA